MDENYPRYEHDCNHCVFLGQYGEYDLYYCPQPMIHLPTIVARFGDWGGDYHSGRFPGSSWFDEGWDRANNLGLT
jgi:hypothetical protein